MLMYEQKVPLEALLRSLSLVLLDNASAEFTFIVRFFARPQASPDRPTASRQQSRASAVDARSEVGSRAGRPPVPGPTDDLKDAERIWHEIFDSAMEYINTFFETHIVTSPPPAIPLLTMIRLNDRLLGICDSRGTIPLEAFLQRQKLAMWPIFRKEMDAHVDGLKKLADVAEGKGSLFGSKGVKDGAVRQAATKYASLFSSVCALSEEADEAMVFSR